MSNEELERLVKSHERALLIVADTEDKARDLINISIWLSAIAIVMASMALIWVMAL